VTSQSLSIRGQFLSVSHNCLFIGPATPRPCAMPIRPATKDEQTEMAKLAAQAFIDDELFADVIHPHRKQYPNDTYLYWLPRLRQGWADPSNHYLVSTIERGNGQGEEIAAWAQFTRKSAKAKTGTTPAPVDVSDLPPNRAASKEYEDILERSYDSIAHEWAGQSFSLLQMSLRASNLIDLY